VDEAEIAIGGFVVSGGQSARIFELVKAAFDHIAQRVDRGIDRQLNEPVSFGGDHCGAAAPFHIFANEVGIIAFVSKQHLWRWPVGIHDRQISLEIGDFTAGQCKRDRQAHCIDAEMDLGREATF